LQAPAAWLPVGLPPVLAANDSPKAPDTPNVSDSVATFPAIARRSIGAGPFLRADAGTRTPDPFITSEVLYQLSYVGILALQCDFG
jgi:hypothetical protein